VLRLAICHLVIFEAGSSTVNIKYNEKEYWDSRYKRWGLQEVGGSSGTSSVGGGGRINKYLYLLRKKSWDDILRDMNIDLSPQSVLDVGCGTGYWAGYFINRGIQSYTGIDVSPTVIEHLSEKYPDHEFINLDMGTEMNLRKKFDIINAYDVLYHITNEAKFEKVFSNFASLSKEGALCVISGYFDDCQKDAAPHVKHRSFERYQELLSNNGLKIIKVVPVFYFLGRIVGLTNKDINHSWLVNYLLLPFYFRGWFAFVLYYLDMLAVGRVNPRSRKAKTKILVAVKEVRRESVT